MEVHVRETEGIIIDGGGVARGGTGGFDPKRIDWRGSSCLGGTVLPTRLQQPASDPLR